MSSLFQRQFSSLANYNYRVYFCGQLVSLVGTWMQTTAQAWLVLKLTGSADALGFVIALQFLPITVFSLFGGVFADRWPKRRVLIITQSIAMLQAATLGVLVATGSVELWHVYVLAALLGTVNAFDGPVRQTFAVELVGKEQLVNAVALNSSIFNMARIVGPGIAGLTIAYVGNEAAFFLNAGSFLAVIGAYFVMRPGEFRIVPKRATAGHSVFRQIGEGIGHAVRTPSLLTRFIMLAAIGTFGFNFTIVIPLVAEFVLKVGPERFGLLSSAMGLGSLIAALVLAATGKASNRVLFGSAVGFSILLGGLGLSHSFPLTAALLLLFGIVSIVFSTTINTSIQMTVPDELRGRVMSIFFLLMAGSTPIGGLITGQLADRVGVPETLVIEAALCALGVAGALLYHEVTGRSHARRTAARPAAAAPAD